MNCEKNKLEIKKLTKKIVRMEALLVVFPLYVLFLFQYKIARDKDRVFRTYSEFLSGMVGKIGDYIRYAFYRLALKNCGKDCCISYGTIFPHRETELGDNVYIGLYCIIGRARIGSNVLVASRVSITSGKYQHGGVTTDFFKDQLQFELVSIGENTWIGEGAIIMSDVGKNCIIGAGSIVVNSIEDNSVAVGNPAKVIKKR